MYALWWIIRMGIFDALFNQPGNFPAARRFNGDDQILIRSAHQAPADAASIARRSLAPRRWLSDLSCPQAAIMSRPRGVRTGEA